MDLKSRFNAKRIISGLLASIMLSQAFIYGDGTCKGLLHTDTINAITNDIEIQQNKQNLIDEFEQNVYELENFNQPNKSLFSLFSSNDNAIQVDSLNVSGYIGFEDDRPCEATVIVFDDNWRTIASTTTDGNGWFSIETGSIVGSTSTTHIKVECNGYLPRFYKDMGFGSYQLGTQDNPEVLLCGDTTYNEGANNQWSDEVINDNDITFLQQAVGTYTQNSRYDEYYDTSGDGIIDDTDIGYLSSFLDYRYENGIIYNPYDGIILDDAYMNIFLIDYNGNYIIEQDEIDYFLGLYPLGTIEYKGDSSLQYMDIDSDGYISQSDANYLINYATKNNELNPYNDYISNIILTGDTYHNGAMYLENTNLDLNGYKLVVNGNFVFRTVNPYNPMWNDNPAVTLDINGGTLYIKEQFDFGQLNSYDKIVMNKEDGELYIFGNWNYVTLADVEGLWTNGTIYFCGSNWQVNEASGDKSVYSTEKHSIWFYYEYGQQIIRWDNTKDYTFDPVTGKKTTLRALNFGYTDKSTGTCLGVFFPYGYTDDKYYFKPSLPEYITKYKDEDGNGIDDDIDYLISIGGVDVPKDWIINTIGTDENGQDISALINPENPNSDDNTSALAKWLGDVKKGIDGAKNTYGTIKNTLIQLSNSIPNEVKLAYDGLRFFISISPDPICQSIDFVLSIGDVAYDLLTFECTTAWFADLGLDLIGVIPYVGAIKEFMHNAKNVATLTKLKAVDGLVGWVTQKGLIDTVNKVKLLPESSIAKTFEEMFNNLLPKADDLLALEGVPQRLNKIALSVAENPSVPTPKDIDRQVNLIRLNLDINPKTTEKALNLIENVLTSNTTKQQILDIVQNIKKADTTETLVKLIENNGAGVVPLLQKCSDKVENIVDLTKKHQNINVLEIVKIHSDEPEYVVKLFDYKPYTAECEKYIQPDKYNDDWQRYLEDKYKKIRMADLDDITKISEKTGLSIEDTIKLKKHLFLNTYELSIEGLEYKPYYFQADPDVAYGWQYIVDNTNITENQLDWFKKLAKHELTEAEYMEQGMPLYDRTNWSSEKNQFLHNEKNAHDKANETAPCPKEVPDIDYNKDWERIMIYGYNGE